MSFVRANFQERFKASGELSVYAGRAFDIKRDHDGNIIDYSFERRELVSRGKNILTKQFFLVAFSLNTAPCVIGIGNGDNGTINGTGGLVDPTNAPNENDTALNNELDNGRFPCLALAQRFNSETGVATFNSLYLRASYAGQITEWGLFTNPLAIQTVGLNTKGSGFLIARRADVFTKSSNDDLVVVWRISVTLN